MNAVIPKSDSVYAVYGWFGERVRGGGHRVGERQDDKRQESRKTGI